MYRRKASAGSTRGSGYLALGLVLARVLWGFTGSLYARFANFVPTPRKLRRYLGALLQGWEPRSLGHNPAGAVMIVFLLGAVAGIGITGGRCRPIPPASAKTATPRHAKTCSPERPPGR